MVARTLLASQPLPIRAVLEYVGRVYGRISGLAGNALSL
jgi:hypothetical protein